MIPENDSKIPENTNAEKLRPIGLNLLGLDDIDWFKPMSEAELNDLYNNPVLPDLMKQVKPSRFHRP